MCSDVSILQCSNTPILPSLAVTALDLAKQLKAKFGDVLSEPAEFRGEITVQLANAERIAEVCEFAKKELGFDYSWTQQPRQLRRRPALDARLSSAPPRGQLRIAAETGVSEENPNCRPSLACGARRTGTSAKSTT